MIEWERLDVDRMTREEAIAMLKAAIKTLKFCHEQASICEASLKAAIAINDALLRKMR